MDYRYLFLGTETSHITSSKAMLRYLIEHKIIEQYWMYILWCTFYNREPHPLLEDCQTKCTSKGVHLAFFKII